VHLAAVAATQDLPKALLGSPKPSSSLATLAADDDVFGSLQLSMNCSNPDVAASATKFLIKTRYQHEHDQSLIEDTTIGAAAVSRLVVTAATRRHSAAVHHMASTPAVLQEVDTRAHQSVLLHLIQEHGVTALTWLLGSHESSIAQQLSAEATVQLLQAAVENKCDVEPLCAVPAAQRLQSQELLQLLQAAVAKDKTPTVANTIYLFRLPSAQQFDGGMCAQLLETAIKTGTNTMVLLDMEAVQQQLSPSLVARLLEVAIEHDDESVLVGLLDLESARQLSLSSLKRVLAAALQRSPDTYSWRLLRVPAVGQLTPTELDVLLIDGLEGDKEWWAETLFELPAAQEMAADFVLNGIKNGIIAVPSIEDGGWLRSLPVFQQMSSDAVFELLQAAVSRGPAAVRYIAVMCELPAAKQLSSESLQQLLLAANEQHGQHANSGFAMPIAQLASRHATGRSLLKRVLGAIFIV
jgi:hypothetical protein